MDRQIAVATINPHISCHLCRGYLVDATAITECLHAFCKSCIVKCMEDRNTCPKCDVVIHRSNPLLGLRPDRTLQDVVYKLVPNLQQREILRKKIFKQMKGIALSEDEASRDRADMDALEEKNMKIVRDDPVCVQLETVADEMEPLQRRFICCPSHTTVTHLKKLIAKKLYSDLRKYCSLDILCKDEVLGKDHTMKFIYVTRWRFEEPPLKLYYRPCVGLYEQCNLHRDLST